MAQIHTLLTVGGYRVTEDSGIQIDPDTTLATRRQSIVFRGSLQSLYSTFRFGEQGEVPDGSQTRMYCSGAQSVRQVDGTSANPHWQATVEHVGLHSYVHGSVFSVFRLTPLWTVRETTLPQTYPDNADGTSEFTFYAGVTGGYLPSSGVTDYHPCTIHDHVPGYQARGIIVTPLEITPSHPYIKQLLLTLGTPDTADTVDYKNNPGAGYNWCKDMPQGTSNLISNTVGKWFVGDISSERVIEPMTGSSDLKIYQVTFPIRWLQRKAPI